MPLTSLPTTTRKCLLLVAFLPLWIPRGVPISSHHTQDELLCGGKPCSRQRLLPQYLDTIRPLIKKVFNLAALTSGFQTLLTVAHKQSPMIKIPSANTSISQDTAVADEVTVLTTKEKTPPSLDPADWLQWKSDFCDYRQISCSWLQTYSA